MASVDEMLSQWNPMDEDFKDASFNSYNRGLGQDIQKPQERSTNGLQVFVNNIPSELTEEGLSHYFRMGGMNPLAVKKCRSKQPGAEATFGFVTYATVNDCEAAIRQLNGHKIGKHTLRVSLARPQEQKSRYEGGLATPSETSAQSRNNMIKEKINGSQWSSAVDVPSVVAQRHVKGGGRGLVNIVEDSLPGAGGDFLGRSAVGRGIPRLKAVMNASSNGATKFGMHSVIDSATSSKTTGPCSYPVPLSAATPGLSVAQAVPGLSGIRAVSICSPVPNNTPPPKVATVANGKVASTPVTAAEQQGSGTSGVLPPGNLCTVCSRIGSLRCGKCKQPYCSKACQQEDWPKHKAICHKVLGENEFTSNFEICVSDQRLGLLASIDLDENGMPILPESTKRYMADWVPASRLDTGQKHKAELCHFTSPSSFWIQLSDEDGSLKQKRGEFEQRLNQMLRDTVELQKEYRPIPGELCFAKYTTDNNWYRVAIKHVDAVATGLFIDYGNEETLSFNNIRPIDTSFADLPQQAIPCALADINPIVTGVCPPSVLKICSDAGLMLFQPVDVLCVAKASGGNPAQVKLYTTPGMEVGACLQRAGLAGSLAPERCIVKKSLHEELDVGEQVKICITLESIVSPDEFSAQVISTRHSSIVRAWQTMSAALGQASHQQPDHPAYQYHVGDFVQARFAGSWYRARVQKVLEATDKLELVYVDYGNTEMQSTSDVCPLASAFADVPCMSCACELACETTPKARQRGQWPNECIKAMVTAVSGMLAFDGYVKARDNVTNRLILSIPKLSAVVDASATAVLATRQPSPVAKLVAVDSGPRVTQTPSQPITDSVQLACHSVADPITFKVRAQNTSSFPKAVLSSSTFGLKSGKVMAMVSYVSPTSAGLFYVQANTHECPAFYEMTQALPEYGLQPPSIVSVEVGEVLIGFYTLDPMWCRCRVLEVYQSKGEVRVYYVDFGNEEVLPLSLLRPLPEQFLSLPAQATPCRLNGTESLNQRVVFNQLKAYEMKRIYVSVVHIDAVDKEVRIVDVYDQSGLHLNKQLRIDNRAHITHPSGGTASILSPTGFPNSLLQKQPPPMRRHILAESLAIVHPKKDDFPLMITYIISPKLFYGQILSADAKNLDVAMAAFTAEVTSSKSTASIIDDWMVGELVVAKWKEDNCWYRGVVTSLEFSSANIRFVDFGNEAIVEYSDLRVPSPTLLSIPIQALRMCLHKFDSGYGSGELELLKKHFEPLVNGQLMSASLVEINKSGDLVVALVSKDGGSISAALLSLLSPKPVPQAVIRNAPSLGKNILEERQQLIKKIASKHEELAVLQEQLRQLDASSVQ